MPTGYIIDYIRICFHIFLKLRNIGFNYFRMEGSLELGSQKHFPLITAPNKFIVLRGLWYFRKLYSNTELEHL
jgi:hypothetical protein